MKLTKAQIEKIKKVLKKHGIKKAGIFGSYATGEATKGSDVDILVETTPATPKGFGFVGIALELEDSLGRKVDVITYKNIYPRLKQRILEEEVQIL
tara:strand:+ start:181 stop:468 length:288 start_codon:yes stop_codon:yes gene_type:complete